MFLSLEMTAERKNSPLVPPLTPVFVARTPLSPCVLRVCLLQSARFFLESREGFSAAGRRASRSGAEGGWMTKASADNTFSAQDKIALGLTPGVAGTTNSASVVGRAVPVSRQDRESPHSADNDVVGVDVPCGDKELGPRAVNIAEGVEVASVALARSGCTEGRSGDATACPGKAGVTSVDSAATVLEERGEAVAAAGAGRETSCDVTDTFNEGCVEGSLRNKDSDSSSSSNSNGNGYRAGAHRGDSEDGIGSREFRGSNSHDSTEPT